MLNFIVIDALSMSLKVEERNISNKQNKLKNPNCRGADHLN